MILHDPKRIIAVAALFAAAGGAQQLPKAAAEVKVFVTTGSVGPGAARPPAGGSLYELRYDATRAPNRTDILPQMQYLSLVGSGGPIDPISYTWVPFEWAFPNLVLEVTNKGREPLTLTSAVFTVKKSVLDPTPVPVIRPDNSRMNARHFMLTNEGWGDIAETEADFNLLPLTTARSANQYNPPFAHTVKVGSVTDQANVDVSAAFVKEGLSADKLPSGPQRISADDPVFGKFKGGGALLVGRLRYKASTPDGRTESRALKFSVEVWLYNELRAGVPRPPSYEYEAKFQVTGTNYTEVVPIKKTVGPGAQELVTIRLGVAKSSVHDFDVSLRSAGARVDSPPLHLEMVIPKSGAKYVQGH